MKKTNEEEGGLVRCQTIVSWWWGWRRRSSWLRRLAAPRRAASPWRQQCVVGWRQPPVMWDSTRPSSSTLPSAAWYGRLLVVVGLWFHFNYQQQTCMVCRIILYQRFRHVFGRFGSAHVRAKLWDLRRFLFTTYRIQWRI